MVVGPGCGAVGPRARVENEATLRATDQPPGTTGVEGVGGPGCSARGRWRGLAGLRVNAPSRRLAARTARGRAAAHGHIKQPGPAGQTEQPGPAGQTEQPGRAYEAKPQELGGVTTHGSVDKERNPEIPRASAMSEAQRAPGTPSDEPINDTTSSVDQPRPRRSERVTAPSRLAKRAPEGASARGTCA